MPAVNPDLPFTLDPPPRSLQTRLYERLRSDILSGRFRGGEKLPSSRALASSLRLSRTTVVLAYEQLLAEGYLEARPGSGTFVSEDVPLNPSGTPSRPVSSRWSENAEHRKRRLAGRSADAPSLSRWGARLFEAAQAAPAAPSAYLPFDFRPGRPAWKEFPWQTWRRLAGRFWAGPPRELASYGDPAGYAPLREAISAHLGRSRGVRCEPRQVVVVNGVQQAVDLLARIWLDPGDAAAVEDPGYPEAALALRAYGVYVLPIPVDTEGLQVHRLPAAATQHPQPPRLIYVTPSHQFPTGTVLSLRRRLALLEWAAERDALVVEDDYDSEFRYEGRPLESLQGLDRAGSVAYVGSFSTALFAPLRLGYAVLPERLLAPFVAAKRLADRQTATLEQWVLAEFMGGGSFVRHLRRMGRLYRARREALLTSLRRELSDWVEPDGAGAGLHLIGWLRPDLDEAQIAQQAARAGVGVYPLGRFRLGAMERPGLLLGFAALDEVEITEGVRRLAAVIRDGSRPGGPGALRPMPWRGGDALARPADGPFGRSARCADR
jgi:GntR family transcriptional regulator/MocR family aminotransferase